MGLLWFESTIDETGQDSGVPVSGIGKGWRFGFWNLDSGRGVWEFLDCQVGCDLGYCRGPIGGSCFPLVARHKCVDVERAPRQAGGTVRDGSAWASSTSRASAQLLERALEGSAVER